MDAGPRGMQHEWTHQVITEASPMSTLTTEASRPRRGEAHADADVVVIGAGFAGLVAARMRRSGRGT